MATNIHLAARHGVTCPRCLQRLERCPTNEHGFPLAALAFEVGGTAKPDMGHAMYFTTDGRVAMCIARERDEQPQREAGR